MGKSDPFLQISKVKPDGGTMLVHRTEVNPRSHIFVKVTHYLLTLTLKIIIRLESKIIIVKNFKGSKAGYVYNVLFEIL